MFGSETYDDILMHLGRLIAALEERTSAQARALNDAAVSGVESRAIEEDLWRNMDALIELRNREWQIRSMSDQDLLENPLRPRKRPDPWSWLS